MRGGDDDMFDDLVAYIHAGDAEALSRDATAPPRKRLVPEFMLKLAHTVSPFSPTNIIDFIHFCFVHNHYCGLLDYLSTW
jgi:hypothetical protein